MALLDTMAGLDPFLAEFDRLSRRVLGGTEWTVPMQLPMDVSRQGDEFVICVDLPGVKPESIDVTLDGRALTIAATREAEQVEGEVFFLRSRSYGTVRQQLSLPDGLDAERVTANYHNGVLTVRVPVAEHAKPRRIAIDHGGGAKQISASS